MPEDESNKPDEPATTIRWVGFGGGTSGRKPETKAKSGPPLSRREEVLDKARAAARSVARSGARVHFWQTAVATQIAPTIEGFEAAGWELVQMTSHFRDFKVSGGLGGIATIAYEKQMRSQGTGENWNAVADVYNLLFRYRGTTSDQ